uniref:CD99 molecule n=1 Tax=Amphilophus citrinellus TaxID=61819 RepID=A0A3Q0S945_AMPCI
MDNLESAVNLNPLTACLWEKPSEPTWLQGEHANSTQKGCMLDSNPGPSCCEAAVLTTVPSCCLAFILFDISDNKNNKYFEKLVLNRSLAVTCPFFSCPAEAGSGPLAGIISAVGVALVGAASSYFAYQKKKLCFKMQGGADPESGKGHQGTHSEPQALSNLLQSN